MRDNFSSLYLKKLIIQVIHLILVAKSSELKTPSPFISFRKKIMLIMYYVSVLSTLRVLTHILLQATLETAVIIIMLHVRNLKHREVKSLSEITQLCHKTGISTQVVWCFLSTSRPPRYGCLQFNRPPQRKTLLSLGCDALPLLSYFSSCLHT